MYLKKKELDKIFNIEEIGDIITYRDYNNFYDIEYDNVLFYRMLKILKITKKENHKYIKIIEFINYCIKNDVSIDNINIKYADYLAENLDTNIDYTEYLAERLDNDKYVKYAEYLAENMGTKFKEL